MDVARGRYLPPVVVAYAVAQLGVLAYGLAQNTTLWYRPVVAGVFIVLWLAAIVVWRQRWAWGLSVLGYAVVLISPAWGRSLEVIYAFDVVMLALLISSPMRRYVGAVRRPTGSAARRNA
jgi:hypothetical protein